MLAEHKGNGDIVRDKFYKQAMYQCTVRPDVAPAARGMKYPSSSGYEIHKELKV